MQLLVTWKYKTKGNTCFFSAYFASQFTTQHLTHLHDMTTVHINWCSQAYWDAISVNCHDNFAPGPFAHDTLYQAGPAGCVAPSEFTSQLEPEGAVLCALTYSLFSGICCCSAATYTQWLILIRLANVKTRSGPNSVASVIYKRLICIFSGSHLK